MTYPSGVTSPTSCTGHEKALHDLVLASVEAAAVLRGRIPAPLLQTTEALFPTAAPTEVPREDLSRQELFAVLAAEEARAGELYSALYDLQEAVLAAGEAIAPQERWPSL